MQTPSRTCRPPPLHVDAWGHAGPRTSFDTGRSWRWTGICGGGLPVGASFGGALVTSLLVLVLVTSLQVFSNSYLVVLLFSPHSFVIEFVCLPWSEVFYYYYYNTGTRCCCGTDANMLIQLIQFLTVFSSKVKVQIAVLREVRIVWIKLSNIRVKRKL